MPACMSKDGTWSAESTDTFIPAFCATLFACSSVMLTTLGAPPPVRVSAKTTATTITTSAATPPMIFQRLLARRLRAICRA